MKINCFAAIMLLPSIIFAGQAEKPVNETNGLMWVAMVILAAWAGIALYIFILERKVSSLEKELDIEN